MNIDKNSLKARTNKIAKEKKIPQSITYPRFFFDAFILRLSMSKYKDIFLLKGGLFLASKFGVENRSTMDIDFLATGIDLSNTIEILRIVDEICDVKTDDNVCLETDGWSRIKASGKIPGIRIRIKAKLENVRQTFSIDIATGDPVVSPYKNHIFPLMIMNERIEINTYSLESVVAEKLETTLVRGIENTRQKDLYDLFRLKEITREIDKDKVRIGFKKTCDFRNVKISKDKAFEIIDFLSTDFSFKKRWEQFSRNNSYANKVGFDEIIDSIKYWANIIFLSY